MRTAINLLVLSIPLWVAALVSIYLKPLIGLPLAAILAAGFGWTWGYYVAAPFILRRRA